MQIFVQSSHYRNGCGPKPEDCGFGEINHLISLSSYDWTSSSSSYNCINIWFVKYLLQRQQTSLNTRSSSTFSSSYQLAGYKIYSPVISPSSSSFWFLKVFSSFWFWQAFPHLDFDRFWQVLYCAFVCDWPATFPLNDLTCNSENMWSLWLCHQRPTGRLHQYGALLGWHNWAIIVRIHLCQRNSRYRRLTNVKCGWCDAVKRQTSKEMQ